MRTNKCSSHIYNDVAPNDSLLKYELLAIRAHLHQINDSLQNWETASSWLMADSRTYILLSICTTGHWNWNRLACRYSIQKDSFEKHTLQ